MPGNQAAHLELIQPTGRNLSFTLREYENKAGEFLTLPPHAAVACDEPFRRRYSAMLGWVANWLGMNTPEDRQLFQMILGSLGLICAEQSPSTTEDEPGADGVLAFLGELNRNNLALSFLVDSEILFQACRKVTVGALKFLQDWANALKMPDSEYATVGAIAELVLYGSSALQIPSNFDLTRISNWSEFLFQPLTAEKLEGSCLGGYWLVDQKLMVGKRWQLSGAQLIFTERGSLNTEACGMVLIEDSILIRPRLSFTGSGLSLRIKDSQLQGTYPETAAITAIQLNAIGEGWFSKLNVSTRNARSFLALQTPTEFVDCRFVECGNQQLAGAGIAVKNGIVKQNWFGRPKAAYVSFSVNRTLFEDCISLRGGSESPENLGGGTIANVGYIVGPAKYSKVAQTKVVSRNGSPKFPGNWNNGARNLREMACGGRR